VRESDLAEGEEMLRSSVAACCICSLRRWSLVAAVRVNVAVSDAVRVAVRVAVLAETEERRRCIC